MPIDRPSADLRTRRLAFLALSAILLSFPAFPQATGAKSGFDKAQGLENWEHSFDISKYQPGVYNIVVQGEDVAGNVAQAAPINVRVDPLSDLPIVSVINPTPLLRVGGDLNIVGTCRDDDGVGRVEVSLDGGDYQPAQGGEFWSLYLATKPLPEGRRTLSIRGVDINGTIGPVVKVSFDLDRTRPLAGLASPEPGALVAGAIKLRGQVLDANGIASLEASTDGGKAFAKVPLQRGKDATAAAFSIDVDTRKFKDGPAVVWFRSVDGVGSKGSSAYLLFIDNTKPTIEVARPAAGESVHGRFMVAGAVRDAIGIAKLSWEMDGKTAGDIALVPGNPYFTQEVDLGAAKGDKAQIALVATDRIGNVTRLALSPKIDREADKPRVRILWPAAGGTVRAGERVWGGIDDDEGGAAILVSVDKGPPQETRASDVFSWTLPELASGKHQLSLQARDEGGTLGNPVTIDIVMDRGPGSVSFRGLAPGAKGGKATEQSGQPYVPGMAFRVDEAPFLEGSVTAPNPVAKASWKAAGGAERKLELVKGADPSAFSFRLPLDRSLPYGATPIEVRVEDAFGNASVGKAFLWSIDLGRQREDTGFIFDDPRIGEGGRVLLSPSEPLRGAFYREDIEAVRLEPATDVVKASFEGRTISIEAAREGLTAPTRVVVRTRQGREWKTDAFTFVCDLVAPRISFDSPAPGAWLRVAPSVAGHVLDSGGIASVKAAVTSGTAQGAEKELPLDKDGRFSLQLQAADLSQGIITIEVNAADRSGNASRSFLTFGYDSEAPKLAFVSPGAGASVSGPEDVAALISDLSGVAGVEYAADGREFAAVDRRGGAFIHRADLAANPKAAYRVTDKAGNQAVFRPEVTIAPRPVQVPFSDSVAIEPLPYPAEALPAQPIAVSPATAVPAPASTAPASSIAAPPAAAPSAAAPSAAAPSAAPAPDAAVAPASSVQPGDAASAGTGTPGTAASGPAVQPPPPPPPPRPKAASEPRIELAGSAGPRKISLVLPAIRDTEFAAIDLAGEPPARFAQRILLSGNVNLKGTVKVDIKAKAVSLSLDGGATYSALFAAKDEKSYNAAAPVAFTVDTTKLQDGEFRMVLRVEDSAGALTFAPIYALVDNGKPDLSVVTAASPAFAGPVPVVVKAQDARGVTAASLAVGAEKRELPVGEGGSWYAAWVDFGAVAKASGKPAPESLALSLEARDEAGNPASAQAKYTFDALADTPRLDISLPAAGTGGILSPAESLRLSATDDDGAPLLSWSLDGGETTTQAVPSLALALAQLAPGKHSFSAEARDESGRSVKAARQFVVPGPGPVISGVGLGRVSATTKALETAAWQPGMEIEASQGIVLSGFAAAVNGLSGLEFAVNGAPAAKAVLAKPASGAAADSPVAFTCAVPSGLPLERSVVELVARDAAGLETRRRYDFHNILPSAAAEASDSTDGLRVYDLPWTAAAGDVPARLDLAPGKAIAVSWQGRSLRAVSVVPATPLLSAALEGNRITLESKAEGLVAPARLRLVAETVDGDRFELGPFGLVSDAAPPALALALPEDDLWTKAGVALSGTASDPNGLTALSCSVNSGSWMDIPLPKPKATPADAFNYDLSLAAAEDGPVRVEVMARDGAGRESRILRFLNKDTVAPVLAQVLPAEGETVNGTTTFIGESRDRGHVASAAFLAAKDAKGETVDGLALFSRTIDLQKVSMPLPEGAGFVLVDRAGNRSLLQPKVLVDNEKDKPVIEVQAPQDMEVLRADFAISGSAYDDDGVAHLDWRLDGGQWTEIVPKDASFSIPVALADIMDNEHLVELQATDVYGVKGNVASRRFRVSKEEPSAVMTAPPLERPSRGLVELRGNASDANGIKQVSLSFDNGRSYELADGLESWSYPLDTRILKDGLHAITLKPVDRYDTEGFYATILSIDNTPPVVELSLPADGSSWSGSVPLSGRVLDAMKLESARVEVAPIGQSKPAILTVDLGSPTVVRKSIDLSSLAPGDYSVRLVARDLAGNESLVSRDVTLRQDKPLDRVELLFPVEGEEVSGTFRVSGRASISGGASSVTILLDGADAGPAPLDSLGYFSFEIPAERLQEGSRSVSARGVTPDGRVIESRKARISWKAEGPWIAIQTFQPGSYIPGRPYLEGKAGWLAVAPAAEDKAAMDAYRKLQAGRRVARVELSLDNGKTFAKASGGEAWRFRLETQDYPEGSMPIVVRATFANGQTKVARSIFSLDKTPPAIRIDQPAENGRFNGELRVAGTASDATGLKAVGLTLRKGDKRGYEVPAFIQGLYLDGHYFGATQWEAGVGLTFFSDNVKLQANYGKAPAIGPSGEPQAFYGDVFSAKLIANVLYLPFSSLFGPDWEALSASFGVGAQFAYFTQDGTKPQGISAVIGQLEFPKFSFKHLPVMRKYSYYLEAQLWFIASEKQPRFAFTPAMGVRIGLF